MRRAEKEIRDPSAVEEALLAAEVLHVGMLDGREPYVVPVCFGYEGGAVYFHSAAGGRKLDAIRASPRVAFEAESGVEVVVRGDACSCTVKYRSAMGTGTARILTDPEEKRRGLDAIMRHYTRAPQCYPDDMLARTAVVRIAVESMTGKESRWQASYLPGPSREREPRRAAPPRPSTPSAPAPGS